MWLDDLGLFRLLAAVAHQAHRDAGDKHITPKVKTDALTWLAEWQGCDTGAVKVAPKGRRHTKGTSKKGDGVNDWQLLYEETRHVTPGALLAMARLRALLAGAAVSDDQVQAALAVGAAGVGELLEAAEAPEMRARLEEFNEAIDDSFDAFGRLV